jgi:hypothetical protein
VSPIRATLVASIAVTLAGLDPPQAQAQPLPPPVGVTSYGAAGVPAGHFTLDASVGYPYWVEARATTGIPTIVVADVGVGVRTLLTTWELFVTGKVGLVRADPFALAVFATAGGGAGAAGRNQITFQGGLTGSLIFGDVVTLSGRVFVDAWSDRLCMEPASGRVFATEGPDVCKGTSTQEDLLRARLLHGDDDLGSRDTGARVYLSVVVEAALSEVLGFFAILEGAAFQDGRAAHSSLFNGALIAEDDPIYNGRAGLTFKF